MVKYFTKNCNYTITPLPLWAQTTCPPLLHLLFLLAKALLRLWEAGLPLEDSEVSLSDPYNLSRYFLTTILLVCGCESLSLASPLAALLRVVAAGIIVLKQQEEFPQAMPTTCWLLSSLNSPFLVSSRTSRGVHIRVCSPGTFTACVQKRNPPFCQRTVVQRIESKERSWPKATMAWMATLICAALLYVMHFYLVQDTREAVLSLVPSLQDSCLTGQPGKSLGSHPHPHFI